MTVVTENVGIALALVVAAGASTALGAAVVFFPSIVKLASRRVLAGSLGFSAGVMTYISFVEIFPKATRSFEEAGHNSNDAYLYATLSVFSGVFVMMILNTLVSTLLGGHNARSQGADGKGGNSQKKSSKKKKKGGKTKKDAASRNVSGGTVPACCTKDPVGRLEKLNQMADELNEEASAKEEAGGVDMEMDIEDDFVDNLPLDDVGNGDDDDDDDEEDESPNTEEENKRLVRMGINTAVAIGLHNFPEGLATFVAALDDPRVGAILAFAIAIHNIPEGLCVALPIYYATGNRLSAFMWALLSGASEFVAALLGWAVLANSFSDNLYGYLFGLVTGMMVIISIRELLPTAHFYDPEDTVVTYSYIAGMAVIAFSLVLFLV